MPEDDKKTQGVEDDKTSQETQDDKTPQETDETKKGFRKSILDLDVILFALPFAILIDVLDFVLEIGIVVSLILGAPIVIWMVLSSGNIEGAGKQIQQIRSGQRNIAKQAAKKAAKRALKRGILVFIIELIPILNLVPFWFIVVIQTIRKK